MNLLAPVPPSTVRVMPRTALRVPNCAFRLPRYDRPFLVA
jgi:hypothetical protein